MRIRIILMNYGCLNRNYLQRYREGWIATVAEVLYLLLPELKDT